MIAASFNAALEPTAAPLVHSAVAAVRTRATVPVGGCGSAWVVDMAALRAWRFRNDSMTTDVQTTSLLSLIWRPDTHIL